MNLKHLCCVYILNWNGNPEIRSVKLKWEWEWIVYLHWNESMKLGVNDFKL